jgi:hypothetical protein
VKHNYGKRKRAPQKNFLKISAEKKTKNKARNRRGLKERR